MPTIRGTMVRMTPVTSQDARPPNASSDYAGNSARPRRPIAGLLLIGVVLLALAGVLTAVLVSRGSPEPSHLARVVARPLVAEGMVEPKVSEAEMYAAMSSKLADARRLGQGSSELATVATEYADALNSLRALLADAPSAQPMVRSGLGAWQGSVADDNAAFFLGLLGVGAELSRFSEFDEKLKAAHAKIVAARLRVAEIASEQAAPAVTTSVVSANFAESRGPGTVPNDTLTMRNTSGRPLNNVMVATELTGLSGERFSNLYFVDKWEPNQALQAICRSASPGRETVRSVTQVRFRVFSDECCTEAITLPVRR